MRALRMLYPMRVAGKPATLANARNARREKDRHIEKYGVLSASLRLPSPPPPPPLHVCTSDTQMEGPSTTNTGKNTEDTRRACSLRENNEQ